MQYGLRSGSALRMLAVRLRARQHRLYIEIPGPFVQKGHRNAAATFAAVAQEAVRTAERHQWKLVPRARVAVEMLFFSKHDDIPALHNLVKGYLDPLRKILFEDDRQVACLTASAWRPPGPLSSKERAHENSLFIMVERFAGCVRRFDLWQTVNENPQFRNATRSFERDDDDRLLADDAREERMFDLVGISEKAREDWRKLRRSEFQNKVLGVHRIGWFDRPGGPPRRLATHVGALWKRQAHPLLFSLDLRGLPAHGESSAFKTDVREQLRAVRGRWDDRAHFIVPIELDVQVPEEPGQKPTDLDNVMRYIAPAVAEELLRPPDGYIHGYRIHRVRRGSGGDRAISVRLMREGTIRRFEDSVEKTLVISRWRYTLVLRWGASHLCRASSTVLSPEFGGTARHMPFGQARGGRDHVHHQRTPRIFGWPKNERSQAQRRSKGIGPMLRKTVPGGGTVKGVVCDVPVTRERWIAEKAGPLSRLCSSPAQSTVPAGTTHSQGWPVTRLIRSKSAS